MKSAFMLVTFQRLAIQAAGVATRSLTRDWSDMWYICNLTRDWADIYVA